MTRVANHFSLADITDYDPFSTLGKRIASDPQGELRRIVWSRRGQAGRLRGPRRKPVAKSKTP